MYTHWASCTAAHSRPNGQPSARKSGRHAGAEPARICRRLRPSPPVPCRAPARSAKVANRSMVRASAVSSCGSGGAEVLAEEVERRRGLVVEPVAQRHAGRDGLAVEAILSRHEAAVCGVCHEEHYDHASGEEGQAHGRGPRGRRPGIKVPRPVPRARHGRAARRLPWARSQPSPFPVIERIFEILDRLGISREAWSSRSSPRIREASRCCQTARRRSSSIPRPPRCVAPRAGDEAARAARGEG
jgi:hypothetical protein